MRAGGLLLSAAAILLAACASCSSSSSKGGFGGSSSSGGGSSGSSGGSGGSSGGSGSSSGSGVSAAQACQDMATAACMQLNNCTPFGLTVAYGDAMTCAQRLVLGCTPMVGASGAMVTGEQIDQCAQAIMGETCQEWLDNSQPSACSFMGSLAAGSACGTGAQCQSGYCRLAPGSVCGSCAARAGAGQTAPDGGAACVVDSDCAATLLCGGGTCVAPGMMGAACGMKQPCSRTLACIGGTCKTPIAAGQPCTNATDCDGSKGVACDTMNKKCVRIGTAGAGQACGFINKVLTECTAGATCANIMDGGLMGTCHPPAADGSLCSLDLGCMAPAICTAGAARCSLPNPSSCH